MAPLPHDHRAHAERASYPRSDEAEKITERFYGRRIQVEKMGTFEPEHLAVRMNESHRARARSRSKGGGVGAGVVSRYLFGTRDEPNPKSNPVTLARLEGPSNDQVRLPRSSVVDDSFEP